MLGRIQCIGPKGDSLSYRAGVKRSSLNPESASHLWLQQAGKAGFDVVARPIVSSALEGFNSTIFAYGQTGSGKTFTITGGAER